MISTGFHEYNAVYITMRTSKTEIRTFYHNDMIRGAKTSDERREKIKNKSIVTA